MKKYRDVILSAKSLRTGLFAVCFFAVMCTAGCGKTDDLLSELRGEDTADEMQGGGSFREAEAPDDESRSEMISAPLETQGVRAGSEAGMAQDVAEEIQKIYVHVCGAVKNPGVYELPAGSRFYEAVETAGGFAEGACEDYLNMAALLADGSRLEIPTREEIREREEAGKADGRPETESDEYYTVTEAKGYDPADRGSADASGELVNINTADADGLCRLPGIGEGRAKAIIEYRQTQGRFQKKEDIMQVSGIGEKMYARMEEYLTVD